MNTGYPIGVFDSGYGGLTILKELTRQLPVHDYLYLGDNARAPYGNSSFDTVYKNTLECVKWLFEQGCPLVIMACNTASAKALRNIQEKDLPSIAPEKRVLGVIRPSVEVIGAYSKTNSIGILGTQGTVASGSYLIELAKFFPNVRVYQQACPHWASLVENHNYDKEEVDDFVQKDIAWLLAQANDIDTILLACTHYPLLIDKVRKFVPPAIRIISQEKIVAESLRRYLVRHPETESLCSKMSTLSFFTTGTPADFDAHSEIFFGRAVTSKQARVGGEAERLNMLQDRYPDGKG